MALKCCDCGNEFVQKRKWQKYCSDKCMKKYYYLLHKEECRLRSKMYYHKLHPNALGSRESKLRELNPNWKGDNCTVYNGNLRAYRWFSIPEGYERHHIDGNPKNNDPSNIMIVTRREHMILDGRLERLQRRNRS